MFEKNVPKKDQIHKKIFPTNEHPHVGSHFIFLELFCHLNRLGKYRSRKKLKNIFLVSENSFQLFWLKISFWPFLPKKRSNPKNISY